MHGGINKHHREVSPSENKPTGYLCANNIGDKKRSSNHPRPLIDGGQVALKGNIVPTALTHPVLSHRVALGMRCTYANIYDS